MNEQEGGELGSSEFEQEVGEAERGRIQALKISERLDQPLQARRAGKPL
jgi:hypothetical protein